MTKRNRLILPKLAWSVQASDRGFGKVKSFLKSSLSNCGSVVLLFVHTVVFYHPPTVLGVGVLSTVPPVALPIVLSVNAHFLCVISYQLSWSMSK